MRSRAGQVEIVICRLLLWKALLELIHFLTGRQHSNVHLVAGNGQSRSSHSTSILSTVARLRLLNAKLTMNVPLAGFALHFPSQHSNVTIEADQPRILLPNHQRLPRMIRQAHHTIQCQHIVALDFQVRCFQQFGSYFCAANEKQIKMQLVNYSPLADGLNGVCVWLVCERIRKRE